MNNQFNTGSPLQINTQDTIFRMSKDMKFMGIVSIVYGAISCLTIIGAIFGIPYIIMGIRLKDSGEHFQRYAEMSNPADLDFAFLKQQSFFFLAKVLTIIGIIFFLLVITFYILLFSMFFSQGMNFMEQFNDVALNL
jgi:hypothetical protein